MTGSPARRFAAGAVLASVPLLLLWWMTADGIATTLRPFVSQLARLLMPVGAVTPDGNGGWHVETTLLVTEGKAAAGLEVATYNVEQRVLHRLSLSWPLLLALLVAPPRPARLAPRLGAALAILAALYVAGACAELLSHVLMLVNHARFYDNDALPNVRVAAPAYSEAVFFAGKIILYAVLYFQPLVAPPLLWLALNPRARALFLTQAVGNG